MKSQCFCLTIEDIPHSLLQGATLHMLDALPPSPWKAGSISSLKKHRIHPLPLCHGSSEIRKPDVSVESKNVCKPGVHRRKRDEEQPSLNGGFSHLDPNEYIVMYRATHRSGVVSTNTSTRLNVQGQAGTKQLKRRYLFT